MEIIFQRAIQVQPAAIQLQFTKTKTRISLH